MHLSSPLELNGLTIGAYYMIPNSHSGQEPLEYN